MSISISDAYPNLWHYTTAAGLNGILTSQQLWSTNFRYLNDDEELRGFFDRKFPSLIAAGIDDGLAKLAKTSEGATLIANTGGLAEMKKIVFNMLNEAVPKVTLNMNMYVTSFCNTALGPDSEDGLLSQWRGYGHDGGYAIVFETNGLHQLLKKEQILYQHFFLNFSDVDYYEPNKCEDRERHLETLEWERKTQEAISKLITQGNLKGRIIELIEPIISQAIRHKHRGFREEHEVRVAMVRFPDEISEFEYDLEKSLIKKKILFYPRSGVLVPYVSLFDAIPQEERKLPIKEIVIGPHKDKVIRKHAVEMLLVELGINAKVRVSDIPFVRG
jgi:hypothetical protein